MNEAIDIYCERLNTYFFAEPINLWTNLCFIVAGAILIYRACSQKHLYANKICIYGITCALVGIGSFLFHSFATRWAMLLDVLGIAACVCYALYVLSRNIFQFSYLQTFALFVFMIISTVIFTWLIPSEWVNGSEQYFGVCFTCFLLGALDYYRHQNMLLLSAMGIFVLSLIFRSIDIAICSYIAIGTHFIWHTLNAVVLYIVGQRFFIEKVVPLRE